MRKLRCPFCGSKANDIGCVNPDCGLFTCLMTPKEWNTRPIEDKLRQQLKRARERLRKLEAYIR